MVILHVKYKDQSQFLYETTVKAEISSLIKDLVLIYNGRLKIERLGYEIEELSKHGVFLPPNMQGLTPDQICDLKLQDKWASQNLTEDMYLSNPDPIGRRNGKGPLPNLAAVLRKTVAEAKAKVSKKLVDSQICLSHMDVQDALDMLKGAVMIAYPMGLPQYDPVQLELDNKEELGGTQAGQDVLEYIVADLWWAGKQLEREKKLIDYIGKNEKSKLTVKLQKKGHGPPGREPALTEEQRKMLMLAEYRRQEELKKLATDDDDDSHLNSEWADNRKFQKSFQGLNDIHFSFR